MGAVMSSRYRDDVEMVVLCACSAINLRGIALVFIDLSIDPKLLFLEVPQYLNSGEEAIFNLLAKVI